MGTLQKKKKNQKQNISKKTSLRHKRDWQFTQQVQQKVSQPFANIFILIFFIFIIMFVILLYQKDKVMNFINNKFSAFISKKTTIGPATTTIGPATTTIGPATTTIGPAITTIGPATTTIGPATTTIRPATTTIRPATTTMKPMTTIAPTTTIAPYLTTNLIVWLDASDASTWIGTSSTNTFNSWKSKVNSYSATVNNGSFSYNNRLSSVTSGLPTGYPPITMASIFVNENSLVVNNIPVGTFSSGLTCVVAYCRTGFFTYDGLVSMTQGTFASPFDMWNSQRFVGNGSSSSTMASTSSLSSDRSLIIRAFRLTPTTSSTTWSEWYNLLKLTDLRITTASFAQSSTNFYIGSRGDNITKFKGYFFEILLYSQPLTDTQINSISTYMGSKWNI